MSYNFDHDFDIDIDSIDIDIDEKVARKLNVSRKAIAIDEDCLALHSILGIESLGISVIVYGENGVKIYGNG